MDTWIQNTYSPTTTEVSSSCREGTAAIGVSHLSPSADVIFRPKQGYSLSPIGSPFPEPSTPPSRSIMNKPQQRNFIKSYDLFCSNSPEIANLIDVVSPPQSEPIKRSWENTEPINPPNDYMTYPHRNFSLPGTSDSPSSLVYKLGALSLKQIDDWKLISSSPPLTPPLVSSSPILSPSAKKSISQHDLPSSEPWTDEWISGMGGMEMDAADRGSNEFVQTPIIQDYNSRNGYATPGIWIDDSHFAYRTHLDEHTKTAEYLLNRGRSLSNTRSRSSSSGSASPKTNNLVEEEKNVPSYNVQIISDSTSSSPEVLSPDPPPRKLSRLPYSVSSLTRARLSTHPMTRGYGPRQQQRGYGPRTVYPYEILSDVSQSVDEPTMTPLHAVPIVPPTPYHLRGFHHSFVSSASDGGVLDGKSRSRSAGEATRDKSGKSVPSSPNHHHRYRHKAKMARHRRSANKKDEDLSSYRYELVVKKVLSGQDTRTTLMIKNIPNKYDQEMLLEAINKNFKGTYDFFYLPIDFKNKCNVGYAFINFINFLTVAKFHEEFDQKKWEKFNSEKVCKITFARIQGKSSFIDHFRNSSLMYEDLACRPLIFHSSGPSVGELECFPPANITRPRSGTEDEPKD